MKKILLIMCAFVMGALSGAKAWTSAAPQVGRAYYLYHKELGQFFRAVGEGHPFYLTADLAQATPVVVESGWKFRFYVNGTAYKLYHDDGTASLNANGVDFKLYESEPSKGYQIYTGDKGTFSDSRRWFYATEEGGSCYFPKTDKKTADDVHWQFVPVEEAMSYMANHCASVAETNNVSGWERVTSLEMLKDDPEKYFFAIFSTNVPALMVRTEASNGQGYYLSGTDPLGNPACLFGIESYRYDSQDYFAMKSENTGAYYYPLWDHAYELFAPADGKKKADDACRLTFSYADNAWSIKTWAVYDEGSYWGLWSPNEGYLDGKGMAGNKTDAAKGSFLIYRKLKENINMSSFMSSSVDDWTGDTGIYDGVAPERYNGNNKDFTAGDILYQTINNLPNGNYEVTLWAWENFAPWDKDSNPHPTGDNIAQVFANDAAHGITVIEAYNDRGWNDENKYTLNCHVTDGTLKYGVKNIATGGNWAVCRPISLTYSGPYSEVVTVGETKSYLGVFTADVTLEPTTGCPFVNIIDAKFTGGIAANYSSNENGFIIATADQKTELGDVKNVVVGNGCDNFVLTDGLEVKIPAALTSATAASYDRSVANTNVYGTICLPFNLKSDENIQFYTVKEVDGTNNVLKLETTDAVAAGVPAIYKNLTTNATKIEIATNNATVVAAAGTQGTDTKLVGTFTGETVSANVDKCYYLKGNQFWQGNENFTIPAYRAYIQIDVNAGARLTISTDDDPTAISFAEQWGGAERTQLKDGKYLINGKVIVVKAGKQFYINGALNK